MSTLKALVALGAMLLALLLIGCSDDPSPTATPAAASTVAEAPTAVATPIPAAVATPTPAVVDTPTPAVVDTPTPVAQVQEGVELTTQEYAKAVEEATSGREEEGDDEIEAAFEATASSFSSDMSERMSSLETSDSWSEEDLEFVSEFAKTLLQATIVFFEVVLRVTHEYLDEVAGLRPPAHLSDLHGNFITAQRELLQFVQEYVETVKNTDTEIKSLEDYANFKDIINSLESGPLDPDLRQKVAELSGQAMQACLALEEQLEAELERDVSICN